ncbi:SDR family oxidoreductase [Spirosoma terrae]|uniref:SDR family NAD(P)-dependent oxidoreductase n=1 Tax=Spirosoma terrae TaxID=1968276 RepID=A0A6L9LIX1_9BACT|nr:SDR family NAD(P)-dependent oxidoreductase [Spirosoma terrae]NDU98658.1 SDR family NAD(P)-dependent oxidoreductase [Spirosoma terrae]
MKTTGNTVLITGGSAGIGLEIAKLLSTNGNQVIITGRNQSRLDTALSQVPNAVGFVSDVSDAADVESLVATLKSEFPTLNMVINNAGRALLHNLLADRNGFDVAEDEMRTNYLSIIRLNQLLLPQLMAQAEAAIVNVSSIVAIVPGSLSTYSASKAALHSYTHSLRIALTKASSNVKVYELMPPLVDTEFSAPIGGKNGISAAKVAADLLDGLKNDTFEIRVGNTQFIYDLYRKSPEEALMAMN